MVRDEKMILNNHKSNFKQLVKQNSIRMGSDVTYDYFDTILGTYEWYNQQTKQVKVLLYEYYVYKIRHKEIEKENKAVKALADHLRKQTKIARDTSLDQVASILDARPEFSSLKVDLKKRALEMAIKETLKRELSESSSYDDRSYDSSSRHYSKSNRKRQQRHHHHSRKSHSPSETKQRSPGKRRSRSRSRSYEKRSSTQVVP